MSGAPKQPEPPGSFLRSAHFSGRSPLGSHSKPARIRLPQGASNAAAAAPLAGVAAAFCLSPTASAAAAVTPAAAHHVTVPDATYQADNKAAHLLSATGHAEKQKAGSGLPASYTVRPGDSLSAIAGRLYHNPAEWPVLYWRNHAQIRWADVITTGQVLRIPGETIQDSQRPRRPCAASAGDHDRLHTAACQPGCVQQPGRGRVGGTGCPGCVRRTSGQLVRRVPGRSVRRVRGGS